MATPYSKIFKKFLKRIEDINLPKFEEEEQNEMLMDWLDTAIGFIQSGGLTMKNDLTLRDDELQEFEEDLITAEIEAIALYMVVAWYEPKINSLDHILMYAGSKSEMPKQKEHFEMMVNARNNAKSEARAYFLNYSCKNNSYLS